jgi:ABC-type phosphate/phosphonate transport system substrate-binding protein
MRSTDTLVLGAVAYDPKVVTIWDGFTEYFKSNGLKFDYVLYSNYERQVEGHFAGEHHVAWNSPLAWLQAQRFAAKLGRGARAIAMRDTDRDLTSVIVTRQGGVVQKLSDLAGKTVGFGAADSPQAMLLPMLHLAEAGLEPHTSFKVRRFDALLGKHGDHIGGERDAVRSLLAGEVDACCMIDGNYLAFSREGTIPSGATRVLAQTAPYDHCNFTVLEDAPSALIEEFSRLLFAMSYDNPQVRPLLDLEGLKAWLPGRTEGYAALERAVDRFGTIEPFLEALSRRFS